MYILFPGGLFGNGVIRRRNAKSGYESIIDGFNRNMASLFANEPEVSSIHPPKKPNDTWRISINEDVRDDEQKDDDLWKIFFGESKEEEPKKKEEHKFVPIEQEEEDEYPPYDLMDRKEEPESIFDHIEDFFPTKNEDDANSVPKMKEQQKNPFVFIANRLTFLIKTKQPVIFNTSMIESHDNYMDIAIDEKKTFPKLHNVNDVGRITNELNKDEELLTEIKEYLDDTEWKNIFCFPVIMNQGMENETLAIRFVVTK